MRVVLWLALLAGARAEDCPATELCWRDERTGRRDCDEDPAPLQVYDDGSDYAVTKLDVTTGTYATVFSLEELDADHINAAAIYHHQPACGEDEDCDEAPVDTFYAFASIDGYLCRFESDDMDCFDTPLEEEKANAGAILDQTYYYARNLGDSGESFIYHVSRINGASPDFHDEEDLAFSDNVFVGSVLDFVAVKERGSAILIDDGEGEASYLIGLGQGFEVLIVQLDENGAPSKYAVVPSDVDWAGASEVILKKGFGAAFGYDTSDGASATLYFAANEGAGLFQITLPLSVDDACWNQGDDVETHAQCAASTASISRVADSAEADSNDGMNCPVVWSVAQTYAPTPGPCPEDEVCWTDASIEPWDCQGEMRPVQVLKDSDESVYRAMTLNLETGEYDDLFELEFSEDQHVNAVGLLGSPVTDPTTFYAIGKFDDSLCRFDDEAKVCFGTELEVKANAGVVGGVNYYYALNLGQENTRIHVVEGVNGDFPVFHSNDEQFAVSSSLFEDEILDFAFVSEAGRTVIDDDENQGLYLIGLARDLSVFVAKITDGIPSHYAVVRGTADWDQEDEPEDPGTYGAAFAYEPSDGSLTKVYFASNEGTGMLQLQLPLTIDDECWMTGLDATAHTVCATSASLKWVVSSDEADSNDGLNCPRGDLFETSQPTLSPVFTYKPSYEPTPSPLTAPQPSPTATPTTSVPTYAPQVRPTSLSPVAAPSTQQPQQGPSPEPTLYMPSLAPNYSPSLKPTIKSTVPPTTSSPTPDLYSPTARPSAEPLQSVDCASESNPLQVMKYDGDDEYSVRMLDIVSGQYTKLYDLDWFSGHVNAVGMVYDASHNAFYNIAAFYSDGALTSQLCRFGPNVERLECYGDLAMHKPNAGCVLVDRYYYAKDPGNKEEKGVYWVDRVDSTTPEFHADIKFVISTSLYEDGVLDFAPLRERLDDTGAGRTGLTVTSSFVEDGETADYLIGLGEKLEVLIIFIDGEGYPSKYAVLPSTLNGKSDTDSQEVGAAWTYLTVESTGFYTAELLFSSNEDKGVFAMTLPITVPADCWNEGLDTSTHVFCGEAAPVALTTKYGGPGDDVKSNDGMNCPFVVLRDPTPAPVVGVHDPTPAPAASATPAPVPAPVPAPTVPAPTVPAPTATPSILVSSQLVVEDVPSGMNDAALALVLKAALVDALSGVATDDDVLSCDVAARRRLSHKKAKRFGLGALHARSLQTADETKTVAFSVRLTGRDQSAAALAAELAAAAASGALTSSMAFAASEAGFTARPTCSAEANSLEALLAVSIAEGAPSAPPVPAPTAAPVAASPAPVAPTSAPSSKPTVTFKPTLDAEQQCVEAYYDCSVTEAGFTEGDDNDDDDNDDVCDVAVGDVTSTPAGTTNHGDGVGWCMSTLDEFVGCTASPSECWATCEAAYGDDLVAIDWVDGSCYCQDACPCMDQDSSAVLITRDTVTLPSNCTTCDYYEAALHDECAYYEELHEDSETCRSDYYAKTECLLELQLAELEAECPMQTCVEVLATALPTPQPVPAPSFRPTPLPAPAPTPLPTQTRAPTVKGIVPASSSNSNGQGGFQEDVQSAGSPTMIALTCIGGVLVAGAVGVFLTRSREGAKEKARKARFEAINSEAASTRYDGEAGNDDFGEADWAKMAQAEDKIHIQDSATKALYGADDPPPPPLFDTDPFAARPPPVPDEEAPLSPGGVDDFEHGNMSPNDVDAFLGGSEKDFSDDDAEPPPPSSSASYASAPPLDADDAAEIAAMAAAAPAVERLSAPVALDDAAADPFGAPSDPFGAPANPFAAAPPAPAADAFSADAFAADAFGAPVNPFAAPPPDPSVP